MRSVTTSAEFMRGSLQNHTTLVAAAEKSENSSQRYGETRLCAMVSCCELGSTRSGRTVVSFNEALAPVTSRSQLTACLSKRTCAPASGYGIF